MTVPDPTNAVNGMMQGPAGFGQSAIGSAVGQTQGPGIGIDRAATGGPNMDQTAQPPSGAPATGATATNATRKPQGFLSFLGSVASAVGSVVPGAGIVGGILTGLGGMQAQNQANAAANAATQNETGLAQEIANGPQLAPLIQAEQSGLSSAVDHANAANPGKVLLDGMGQAFTNAIQGVAEGTGSDLANAAKIYGGVATSATTAATAQGNPWSSLGTAIAGTAAPTLGSGAIGQNSPVTVPSQPYSGFGQPTAGPAGAVSSTGMVPPTPANPYASGGGDSPTALSSKRGGF